ncbi:unnamed protein product [Fraxinus pennsylvanica]|uniref:Uncharacterized protein n=1 Tax=Fraxinus pennsylvanica TaxID=56036 RepID=A0AAD1ZTB9_9LAMI|nr:unnamed protein product [Fraxinus pennsylvanica]
MSGLFSSSVEGSGSCLSRANLCSPSPSVSGAGSASAKRFMQKPVRPTGFSPTNTVSPMRTMDALAAVRRKKQKLHEKQFQERVAAILPEPALFTHLLEFESCVDPALTRKKIDIQDSEDFVNHTEKSTDILMGSWEISSFSDMGYQISGFGVPSPSSVNRIRGWGLWVDLNVWEISSSGSRQFGGVKWQV